MVTGGCRCGAVTYAIALSGLPACYACHCLDCQTWSGSAFALHVLLPADVLSVEGPLVSYEHEGAQDSRSTQLEAQMADSKFLTPEEVAERYRGGISVGPLRNWRVMRLGPSFVKIGKAVLHHVDEFDAWEEKNRVPCLQTTQ
jgi:hypothetical protein